MKLNHKEKTALLIVIDMAAMVLAFGAALLLGHHSPRTFSLMWFYGDGLATLIAASIVLFFILDAYSLRKLPQRFLHQGLVIGAGLGISAVFSTAVFFFFRNPVPRAVFLLFFGLSFLFIMALRYVFSRLTLSFIYWRMVIAGGGPEADELALTIAERPYLHTQVVGCLSEGNGASTSGGVPRIGELRDLVSRIEEHQVDQVVVAVKRIDDELMRLLLECMQRKVKVLDFRNLMEEITGQVPITHLTDGWFILELAKQDHRYFWRLKRTLDLTAAVLGLGLMAPLFPFIAALIKLDSPGPVLYSQTRIGRRRKPFRVWKLRTMIDRAGENDPHWTLDKDDRITRVGGLLRKTHIDELPQLYNILTGDMSLIGPRPEAARLVEGYAKEIPYYTERHMVTPGLTGWAQINHPYGNSIDDTRQKLMYDFFYIKNRGLALDMAIFLRTIRTVVTGKGAL